VTCGRPECQKARHCYSCKDWRKRNADIATTHYDDVVKPFRQNQPDYQRRWRLGRRLREIREKFDSLVIGALLTSIRGLIGRAEALASRPARGPQTGVLAGNLLDKTAQALRDVVAGLEPLGKGVETLRSMGLGAPLAR